MKKHLILGLAFIVMLISSCQKNPNTGQVGGQDGMVDFSITTTLPQGPDAYTRAAANPNSALGGLANVNTETHDLRYIMEVWTIGDSPKRVYRKVTTVANNWTTPVTFDARLIAQKYNFVFWADFVTKQGIEITEKGLVDLHYTTTTLDNIVFTEDYKVSDDTRDAYFHKEEIDLSVSTNKFAVTLKRPFAKVRFIATDRPANINSNLVPDASTIEYPKATFYKAFNAITGTAIGTPSVRNNVGFLTATPTVEPTAESTAESATESATDTPKDYLLVFDYILPGASVASIGESNISTMIDGVKAIRPNLPAIPIVANTLVTLKGNLYSNRGVVTVNVTDAFETPSTDVPVADIEAVESIGDVDEVIIKLAKENATTATPIGVKVETAVSVAATITVPATIKKETTPAITYDLSAGIASGATLTIAAPVGTFDDNYAGTINVIVPENIDPGSIIIDAPKAHVTINGQYKDVGATTSSTTLVIEAGATIGTLTVTGGNVEVHGTVTSISRSQSNGDAKTTVTIHSNGENITDFVGNYNALIGDDTFNVVVVNPAAIVNITTGVAYSTVYDAVIAAKDSETVEIQEGIYPYTAPVVSYPGMYAGWALVLNKNGFTIRGVGDVILYGGLNVVGKWLDTSLGSILIRADDVTMDNLIIETQPVYAGGQIYVNKSVEVTTNWLVPSENTTSNNFTMINCTIKPDQNRLGFYDDVYKYWSDNDAGSLAIAPFDTHITGARVIDCNFEFSAVSFSRAQDRSGTSGTVTGCTFNNARRQGQLGECIQVSAITAISDCTFNFTGNVQYAVSARGEKAVATITDCTFNNSPEIDLVSEFWLSYESGTVQINGINYGSVGLMDATIFNTLGVNVYKVSEKNWIGWHPYNRNNTFALVVDERTNAEARGANADVSTATQGILYPINFAGKTEWEASVEVHVTNEMLNDNNILFCQELWSKLEGETSFPLMGIARFEKGEKPYVTFGDSNGWVKGDFITTPGWHILTLKATAGKVEYYINEKYVGETSTKTNPTVCTGLMPTVVNFNQYKYVTESDGTITSVVDNAANADYSFSAKFANLTFRYIK